MSYTNTKEAQTLSFISSTHKVTAFKLLFVLLTPFWVSACATTDAPNLRTSATMTAEELQAFQPTNQLISHKEEDVFNINDTVEVTVHGFEDFSGTYAVDRTGKIYFSHIGEVQVAGKSITELQVTLRQRYGDCCLRKPSVSIIKEAHTLGKIVVDGAVDKPGAFEITKVIKLSEAVALAGGATFEADRKTVILAREFNGERKIITVNLENLQTLGAYDPFIYPNDVIFIQDNAGRLLFNDFIRTVPILSAVIYAVTRN